MGAGKREGWLRTGAGLEGKEGFAAVVVDYGFGPLIAECVGRLLEQGASKVVVVDNGAADGLEPSRSHLGGLAGERVELVEPSANDGYGAGADIGAARTDSRFLFVANGDLLVEPGCTRLLMEALERDEQAAVAGPTIEGLDGTPYPSARRFPDPLTAAMHALLSPLWRENPATRSYLGGESATDDEVRQVDWVSGAAMMFRRAAFEAVGGFDPAFRMYLEEVDLCHRLLRRGWRTLFVPAARARHAKPRSRRSLRLEMYHHLSALRFAVRVNGVAAALPAAAVLAGSFGIRSIMRVIDDR
jgi:N-acetylglucosaminyl-diphospho-decaprenol L-rhamnosyltransferase